jgi:hypothetical protein
MASLISARDKTLIVTERLNHFVAFSARIKWSFIAELSKRRISVVLSALGQSLAFLLNPLFRHVHENVTTRQKCVG